MGSNTIDWHKSCLENSKKSERQLFDEINRLHKQLSELRNKNCFRAFQINEAEKIGKKSFDADKFRKSSQNHGGKS